MERQNKKRDHKKNNKKDNYHNNKYYEPEFFTVPLTGFLITSNHNQEKNAVRDAYNFLNKYVERDYQREIERILEDIEHNQPRKKLKTENPEAAKPNPEEEEEKKEEVEETKAPQLSTNDLLQKELKQYNKEARLFYNVDTKCKGIIFIKLNPLFQDVIDVKKIANKIVKDVKENNIPVSRFCFKLLPVEFATKAALDIFEEQIKKMIARKFHPDKPKKWVLQFKCRNNSKFHQKAFLDIILQNIGSEHSVDYKNPDYTIFVEINNHLMSLSIYKKFNQLKHYSLQLPGSIPPPKPQKEKGTTDGGNNQPKGSLIGEITFDEEEEEEEKGETAQEEQVEAPAEAQDQTVQKEVEEEEDEDIPLV